MLIRKTFRNNLYQLFFDLKTNVVQLKNLQAFCSICISYIWWEINRKTIELTTVLKDLYKKGKKILLPHSNICSTFLAMQLIPLINNYELLINLVKMRFK